MKNLFELIDELGITAVAVELGVAVSTIWRIQAGKIAVSSAIIEKAQAAWPERFDADETALISMGLRPWPRPESTPEASDAA